MRDDQEGSFFSADENSPSIDELIAQDAEDNKRETKQLKGSENKEKRLKKTLIITGSGLSLAVIIGLVLFNPFSDNPVFHPKEEGKGEYVATQETEKPVEKKEDDDLFKDDESFIDEEGKYYPIKTDKWQVKAYDDQDSKKLKADIINSFKATEFETASSILPSEEAGFTSDDNKEVLDDGTLNPLYSYWTDGLYQSKVGEYLNRLLNPTFGGWGVNQYSGYDPDKTLQMSQFEDMFTDDFMARNMEKPYSEYMPIFADWKNNDYGMSDQLLASGSRWIGNIESSNSEFVFNDEMQQYIVNFEADVKFTAWSKDQSKLEKQGKLTLKLVPNVEEYESSSNNKVLIDDASLKVDE